jgi:hypothetical protein
VRKYLALTFIQVLILAGCGGGGGGYGGGGGGGGGGGEGPQVIATAGPPNVEPLIVDQGPPALVNANPSQTSVNVPYVSVRVCIPGMTGAGNCQTVDHIQVDTGSSGLRILSSALTITLPTAMGSLAQPQVECLPFADGSAWGSIALADMTLPTSGETATSVRLQVIGDPTYEGERAHTDCATPVEDTLSTFGANGLIGVGTFVQDCGPGCAQQIPSPAWYYECATPTTCVSETVAVGLQVTNPVTLFATDNTGVIVELPAVGATGQATASGSLVFGIGTQPNNKLSLVSGITVLTADVMNGDTITVTDSSNTQYPDSYLDSGSNGVFFPSSITLCGANEKGFYCPASTMTFTDKLTGSNAATTSVTYSVANAQTLFGAGYAAFSNLGGTTGTIPTASSTVDFGLSFFYGHNVYTAIDNAMADTTMGPYFAF